MVLSVLAFILALMACILAYANLIMSAQRDSPKPEPQDDSITVSTDHEGLI